MAADFPSPLGWPFHPSTGRLLDRASRRAPSGSGRLYPSVAIPLSFEELVDLAGRRITALFADRSAHSDEQRQLGVDVSAGSHTFQGRSAARQVAASFPGVALGVSVEMRTVAGPSRQVQCEYSVASQVRQVQLGYDRPRMSCWNRSATTCCRQIERELLHTPETANSIAKTPVRLRTDSTDFVSSSKQLGRRAIWRRLLVTRRQCQVSMSSSRRSVMWLRFAPRVPSLPIAARSSASASDSVLVIRSSRIATQ